ncbi:alpha-alpha-trehalose phosphate synthase subunit [Penicillium maclennaniae]|uniref:alpha-alpha-trehalose phosphate synthase subunit n=1 Tax=Penicillium maclennaniae TaxID=1343394 RepID=UPI0025420E69|nr:alpha-alpha-trehalose phosphate synthase subunit [Penicillium maclennaniae]KAJ5684437.1 alpha-alpha-trehalose phosphate synthase subunit [Penicillium maclennaniae]
MTVFLASLFLPYTIDFRTAGQKNGRRRSSPTYAVDGSGSGPIVGRLPRPRSTSLELTPGATTEDEKIFKAYASQYAGEIPITDDPKGPSPSEPRVLPWGKSRKFNQPRSKATTHPEPSILSRPGSRQESKDSFLDGAPSRLDPMAQGSPRALLSAVDWVVKAAEQGHGGLQNAVHAAEEAERTRDLIDNTLRDDYESLTVFVGDSEFEGHYAHFCRSVLWPALHYQMQESPRHTEYDDYSWKQYLKVNEAFADTIATHWKPGDCIWVHDYHLLALPALLRKRLPQAEIGFFLHTAFPSSEIFRCLNPREALLDGLLGADLIGFQTEEYCHHFIHSCSRLRRLEVSVDGVQVNDRFVHVKNYPLGIDYKSLNVLRQSAEVKDWISNISERYQGKHLIVARDRLDTPGGIKQKLLAYELFLESYPKWRENVVLVQVASSGSEIPELAAQVSKIAMRINSVYSTLTHSPLVLLQQDISYSQFLALLSVAEVFMATNLREGMNLTSHDFIHCQDGELATQQYGSLILSEFTGSARIFQGHPLLVNPWDYKQCADAINIALEMPTEQKKRNWEFLLACKSPPHRTGLSRDAHTISPVDPDTLQKTYNTSRNRLFFLEDGATFSSTSFPSPTATDTLQALASDTQNTIFLTSSHSPDQLTKLTASLPSNIGLIAENGCFIKPSNGTWTPLVDVDGTRNWRAGIRKVMEYFQERTEGSVISERRCSLTFHYDADTAAHQASELADQINGARGSEAIRVVRDATAVSVELLHVSKATAAAEVIDMAEKYPDFVFVAGGSRGDEALFRWANRLDLPRDEKVELVAVTTLTAGKHATEARARLPAGVSLLELLGLLVPVPVKNGQGEGGGEVLAK